ncbi:MAG: sulfurtransferase [Chloroflexota bacterium]
MTYTTLISTDELAQHIGDDNWAIIDARFELTDTEVGRTEYLAGHIPGAVYAHLDEDLSGPIIAGQTSPHPLPDIDIFAQKLSTWGIDDKTQVVVYDSRANIIASRLWWMLNWLGHTAVAVLDGGWPQWAKEDRASVAGVESRASRQFVADPNPSLVVDADEAARVGQDPTMHLIDCRARARYRGDEEPLDPVAGHIPGAICAPITENLSEDGRFLDEAALRQRFETLLGNQSPENAVFYCGSGVSAAQNLLAMAHVGLTGSKLYAGSWSEWITDAERPIETGERQ